MASLPFIENKGQKLNFLPLIIYINDYSASSASGSASDAALSEEKALEYAERAEQAATTAGYLDVEIDENGHLIYTRTDQVDVDFALDSAGHLLMEVI